MRSFFAFVHNEGCGAGHSHFFLLFCMNLITPITTFRFGTMEYKWGIFRRNNVISNFDTIDTNLSFWMVFIIPIYRSAYMVRKFALSGIHEEYPNVISYILTILSFMSCTLYYFRAHLWIDWWCLRARLFPAKRIARRFPHSVLPTALGKSRSIWQLWIF